MEHEADVVTSAAGRRHVAGLVGYDPDTVEERIGTAEDEIHSAGYASTPVEHAVQLAWQEAARTVEAPLLTLLLWKRSKKQSVLVSMKVDVV